MVLRGSLSFNERKMESVIPLDVSSSTKDEALPAKTFDNVMPEPNLLMPESPLPEPLTNRNLAALKLQKTYKSFRTRRQLADCAILVEHRWWKLLDFAVLKCSSVSFFEIEKPETAVSRWSRARTRAAKVGKGSSQHAKACKLALQHWLEAIDPRHRYGHNLHFYYVKWLHCQSKQPFFYWLDIGEGKEVSLEKCPRLKLLQQCIKYLSPIEREAYEATVEDGKFIYKLSRKLIDTRAGPTNAKWIFVLSTSSILYVGMKRKGKFQHSSFLAGGATLSAGRLVIIDGILKAVWPHSGHYLPTEENFDAFMLFLEQHCINVETIKKSPDDEEDVPDEKVTGYEMRNCVSEPDFSRAKEETEHKYYNNKDSKPPRFSRHSKPKITSLEIPKKEDIILAFKKNEPETKLNPETESASSSDNDDEIADELLSSIKLMVSKRNLFDFGEEAYVDPIPQEKIMNRINSHKEKKSFQLAKHLSCQWSTGAGPRIGCVRDYPSELQLRALEEVCSSGRLNCRNGGSRDRSDRRRKSYSMDNVSFFHIEPP
uniref:IQ domain-containing protein IQM6-like n=1 Tax=Erigeron canadensis TaxID=72917 RepID=UPI001CB99B97|nr:IQ domain-containing protein IQM6-like [Erigeron canadensis]